MSYTKLNFSFQNDELAPSNPNVKYQMTDNGDGTVSFTDVSVYSTYGDAFDAGTLNTVGAVVDAIGEGLGDAEGNIASIIETIDDDLMEGRISLNTSSPSGVDHDLYQMILAFVWEGYVLEA